MADQAMSRSQIFVRQTSCFLRGRRYRTQHISTLAVHENPAHMHSSKSRDIAFAIDLKRKSNHRGQ